MKAPPLGRVAAAAAVLLCSAFGPSAASPGQPVPPPEEDYALQCMGCHLQDGRGLPGRVPPLLGLDRFLALEGGRAYLVRVPGVAQSSLSGPRLSALLNWLLQEFGRGAAPDAPPFTPAEVAQLRETPLPNPAQTRRDLLK